MIQIPDILVFMGNYAITFAIQIVSSILRLNDYVGKLLPDQIRFH
jgi:hypothetical protein